ncbi:FkbM family methyltransferase, partial [Campylobacter fetus]|nr:FkbM family methyltransferase [Campylobacter fetus]
MNIFNTTPRKHIEYGYKPNYPVIILRKLIDIFISFFRLKSNNRFGIEVRQKLIDATISVDIGDGYRAKFITPHGRSLWRAKTILSEEQMMIKWLNSFNENDVFYDIGANVGTYSVYIGIKKNIPIYCFEAEFNNISDLYYNLYLNNLLDKSIIFPFPIHNKTEILNLYVREMTKSGALNNLGRQSIYKIDQKDSFISKQASFSIDDIIKIFNIKKPTKVKIDVDGNEKIILEGLIN